MEGKTHYELVVGGTEEEKEVALTELQTIFDERSPKLAQHELEKSPEDLAIIEKTVSIVDKMVADYHGKPKALPFDHIYVLRPGSVQDMTEGRLSGGIHKPLGLKIGAEKGKSKLLFASTLAHELFHLKSYKSARVGKSGKDVRLYRSGLSMIDKKDPDKEIGEEKEYFAKIEEAIVAECTKKFLEQIGKDSMFSGEARAIERFRDWVVVYFVRAGAPAEKIKRFNDELKYIEDSEEKVKQVLAAYEDEENRQAYAAGLLQRSNDAGEVEGMERFIERKKLYELLDKIVVNSNGEFKSRDEVFDKFAIANFSGDYLPLARIIEGILGPGEFRKLAMELSEEPEKEQ